MSQQPTALQLGLAVPFFDHHAEYAFVREVVEAARRHGFHSIWLSDHITGPTPAGANVWLEAVTLLSHLAGLEPTLSFGADVLVAPYRHPLLCAKMLTTLDIVTGGRLTVAVGSGYVVEEFDALGLPFEQRGAYTDECIEIWKAAWAPGPTTFHGMFFDFQDAVTEPTPVQWPHPPIWVGGASIPALRRAARVADGWHPIGLSIEEYSQGLQTLETLSANLGRPALALSYSGIFGRVQDRPVDGPARSVLSGDAAQVLDDIAQLSRLGVRTIVFRPGGPDVSRQEVLEQIARIGQQILPLIPAVPNPVETAS